MKKLFVLLILLLITGCFGNYNLENAINNHNKVNSLTLNAKVVYYESEYTDHVELEYSYTEKIDWRNQRMKRYDFVNQAYLYYEMFSDGVGNIYKQDADNEWQMAYEQIMVDQDFGIPELNFINENFASFNRHFPFLNTYEITVDPRVFFSPDSVFYEAAGQVEVIVKVGGGYLEEIAYQLTTDEQKIFKNEIYLSDIDKTYVDFPFSVAGDKRPFSQVFETMGERLLKAMNDYYAISVVDKSEFSQQTFIIKNNHFTKETPDISVVGRLPEQGTIIIDEQGNVRMAIYEKGYCLQKAKDNSEFVIQEKTLSDCNLP